MIDLDFSDYISIYMQAHAVMDAPFRIGYVKHVEKCVVVFCVC